MRKVKVTHTYQNPAANKSYIGWLHDINYGGVVIEDQDGNLKCENPNCVQFLDKPEDEQLAEFTKAVTTGLLSANTYTDSILNRYGNAYSEVFSADAVFIAKALISELKKQKP